MIKFFFDLIVVIVVGFILGIFIGVMGSAFMALVLILALLFLA
jgi:hypothetical protein